MALRKRRFAAAFVSIAALAMASPALAQMGLEAPPNPEDETVLLEADNLTDRDNGAGYLASGNVRISYQGRTVYADEVEYWPERNRVIARGDVRIFGEGRYAQTADEVELDERLSEGVAFGFATMLENNGRAAAAVAIRRANGSIELNDAYYTACELCEDEDPSWRIRAREVIRDTEDQMIYYRDAQFEVAGVPVLYAPVFAHADPSSERRSGLLFPSAGVSTRLGAWYQQPYLWSISPYSDLVVAPKLMTNVRPIVLFDYRKRFWSGEMEFEASAGYDQLIDSDGERYGDEDFRWHVFGGGEFDITETWSWGFGVQRTSDKLHMRTYDLSEAPDDLGQPLEAASRRLVSQLYIEERAEHRFISAVAADFQTLRDNETDEELPVIAPLVEGRQVFALPGAWGRINFDVSSAFLHRDQDLAYVFDRSNGVYRGFTRRTYTDATPTEQAALLDSADQVFGDAMGLGEALDYGRVSAGADWRARIITGGGFVFEPFALARIDHFELGDVPVQTGAHLIDSVTLDRDINAIGFADASVTRTAGLAGFDFSLPLYRPGERVDWIIEPVIQGVAATDDTIRDEIVEDDRLNRALILNEDSLSLDLEDSLILRPDRSPGYDVWEEGARATVGMRASAEWSGAEGETRSFTAFAGQSHRLSGDPVFVAASGLFEDESDIVVAAELDLGQFNAGVQTRLDPDDFGANRIDADIGFEIGRLRANARYISFSDDLSTRPGPQSELTGSVELALTEHWSALYSVQRDMDRGLSRREQVGLGYGDECTEFQILYYREDFGGNIGASESIRVRVTLFTLGSADGS